MKMDLIHSILKLIIALGILGYVIYGIGIKENHPTIEQVLLFAILVEMYFRDKK